MADARQELSTCRQAAGESISAFAFCLFNFFQTATAAVAEAERVENWLAEATKHRPIHSSHTPLPVSVSQTAYSSHQLEGHNTTWTMVFTAIFVVAEDTQARSAHQEEASVNKPVGSHRSFYVAQLEVYISLSFARV
ncbi:unnamed protein product [Cylicostephanus goldi]|uniref:Uncharacterized protein n=1 Tax=Cylicostephanus goldi TaxID=71465 RepID=A0A3P6S0B7_CYLGO|nr:unnamed protein product [Cylicostephanus goldi]